MGFKTHGVVADQASNMEKENATVAGEIELQDKRQRGIMELLGGRRMFHRLCIPQ